jgi:hypothetical protein
MRPIQLILSSIIFALSLGMNAQHQEVSEKPAAWKGNESEALDSNSVLYSFKNGKFEGHLRYFFSATDNNGKLSDYYANAAGGGIRYETAKFHGFQFGVSGFFVFNVGSSDLLQRDSLTNQTNRYEIGLFDMEDPTNKKDIDRLEEFYLKYSYKKSFLRFGRQLVNTPFINLQDGRMRPTGVEGFWLEINDINKLKIEGGWLYAMSPRSTVKWYTTSESVGLYPSGVNTNGTKSGYAGEIDSYGAFTLGIRYEPTKWLSIKAWDLYFENVMNSALIQIDLNKEISQTTNLIGGLQFIRQDAIYSGGNESPSKAYINAGSTSMVYGARIGIKKKNAGVQFNYTHITDDGRYLMPREWGRDPFFTFMPRERNEGLGNVHAMNTSITYDLPKQRIKTSLTGGYYILPDIKNYVLNKYALPSYTQFNADIRYSFNGILKGLDAQLLVVVKMNQGDLHSDLKSEINKVNMELYNFVLNYHF